jgi:perosamine synthetase
MSLSDFDRHGARPTTFETYPEIGYNFRITDIQAAIGLAQLNRLDKMLATRRRAAERYIAGLGNHPWIAPPHVPAHVTPNWQSFQVRVRPGAPFDRNQLMERLFDAGIVTRRGVMASHLEAPYRDAEIRLPVTEAAANECLQLPMHAGLTEAEVDRIVEVLCNQSA